MVIVCADSRGAWEEGVGISGVAGGLREGVSLGQYWGIQGAANILGFTPLPLSAGPPPSMG